MAVGGGGGISDYWLVQADQAEAQRSPSSSQAIPQPVCQSYTTGVKSSFRFLSPNHESI